MKKFIAFFLMTYQVLTYTANPRSFGEHDPLNTKAAFCEMMQNHTGTKTEMFYRTVGLFSILDVCRKKPKEVNVYTPSDRHLSYFHSEISDKTRFYLSTEFNEDQRQAWATLQEYFKKVCQEYKGRTTYKIHGDLGVIDFWWAKPNTIANCTTYSDTAYIRCNPKQSIFKNYCDCLKKDLNAQNDTARVNSSLEFELNVQQEKIRDILFHELSHPYTNEIMNHLDKHRLPGESRENSCIEEYYNTLAVLNSTHPLHTASNLYDISYHSEHLVALAKALKKEGVKE